MFIENKITGYLSNQSFLTYLYLKVLAPKVHMKDILKKSQILDIVLDRKLYPISERHLSVTTQFESLAGHVFEGLEGPELFQLNKRTKCINFHLSTNFFKNCNLLTYIDLSYCDLKSIDLNTFVDLSKLRSLNLSHNHISEIIPVENGFKVFFEHLELQNNKLNSFVFDDFSNLNSLISLDLAHNNIEELVNSGNCQVHVESLNLNNNKLRELKEKSFINFLKLADLNLKSNQIETIDSDSFDSSNKITYLDLSKNNLKLIKSKFFSLLCELSDLNLSQNQIETIETNSFDKLFKLNRLDLSENIIAKLVPNLFVNLERLKTLDLSRNRLKQVEKYYFKINHSTLTRLDLSFNRISSYEKNAFSYLMGINTDSPLDNAKASETSNILKIILVGNVKIIPYHTDYDRKRLCFRCNLPVDSKYLNTNFN
jgi:Leucine-rich repeat (LRR) protein